MKLDIVERFGSIGIFIVAASCPVYCPLFIPIGNALGLGFLQPYEGIMMNIVFPAFVILTLIGSCLGYRIHRTAYPLAVTSGSILLILIGFYGGGHMVLTYTGIIGVLVGSVLGFIVKKKLYFFMLRETQSSTKHPVSNIVDFSSKNKIWDSILLWLSRYLNPL